MVDPSSIPFLGTKALDPEPLRRRQQATQRRVREHKALEDAQDEELLRLRTDKPKWHRAQSCPKLPSWGKGQNGHCVNPPGPVLDERPQPPGGAAPLWADMRPGRSSPHLLLAQSPQRRRKVPKLLGAPYLQGLQEFAMDCPSRAKHIVPTMPPRTVPAASNPAGRAASAQPAPPGRAATVGEEQQRLDQIRHTLRPVSDVVVRAAIRAAADVQKPLDEAVDDVLDARIPNSLAEKLWERLPEGHATNGRSTPTTRPPSAPSGATTRPSTRPPSAIHPSSYNSRNSSTPVSRVWSAQSTSRPSRSSPAQRPLSAPSVHSDLNQDSLRRPASSPQLRPLSERPPRMARAASAKASLRANPLA